MSEQDADVDVSVLVADDAIDRIDEVAERLRAAGMRISGVQHGIGTIGGAIPERALEALSAVRGVAAVERGRSFQLPPPDAPVQ
jgi:hypothetical protein